MPAELQDIVGASMHSSSHTVIAAAVIGIARTRFRAAPLGIHPLIGIGMPRCHMRVGVPPPLHQARLLTPCSVETGGDNLYVYMMSPLGGGPPVVKACLSVKLSVLCGTQESTAEHRHPGPRPWVRTPDPSGCSHFLATVRDFLPLARPRLRRP